MNLEQIQYLNYYLLVFLHALHFFLFLPTLLSMRLIKFTIFLISLQLKLSHLICSIHIIIISMSFLHMFCFTVACSLGLFVNFAKVFAFFVFFILSMQLLY
jgi:hypothetical protein